MALVKISDHVSLNHTQARKQIRPLVLCSDPPYNHIPQMIGLFIFSKGN